MTYQIADLPIVRAQLERAADEQTEAPSVDSAPAIVQLNIADNPLVRAHLERHMAAQEVSAQDGGPAYARAPAASGPQQTGARPAATQGATR